MENAKSPKLPMQSSGAELFADLPTKGIMVIPLHPTSNKERD